MPATTKLRAFFRLVVCLIVAGLCAYWILGFWLFARVSDNLNFTLWLWRGRIELWLFDSSTAPSITVHCWAAPEQADLQGMHVRLWKGTWLDIAQVPERDVIDAIGGWPQLYRPEDEFFCISVPVWLILALLAVVLVGARFLRRTPKTHCECGYDLTGNASGRCPECGALLKHSAPPSAR